MSPGDNCAPQLLALDWGTSSLRAFLMQDEEIIETRHSAHGIQHLPQPGKAGFEQAFAHIAGDWIGRWPQLPIVASGMVGSAQGWREAPYVRCPATVRTLAEQNISVASGLGQEILIAPGVLFDEEGELPDVMRGEEIQIAGALLNNAPWSQRATIVLPGTHSKWAQIENGRIVRFATYLTGELFAVLRTHSILGRLMTDAPQEMGESNCAAFETGLASAQASGPGDLSHQLFGARTLGLTGRLPNVSLAEYLSGLLIGNELVSGLAGASKMRPAPLVLIGEPALCQRYVHALQYSGQTVDAVLDNSAPAGLWNFAVAAGRLAAH
jgi:2-dehydro-3-deoxygalactonokinase